MMPLWMALFLAQQAFVSPQDVFRAAEQFYREGRYAEAAEKYDSLLSQGVVDGALFYNLGNAYFKSGRLGLAILHYERALREMPGDEDTKANLDFATSLIADVVERPEMPAWVAWIVDAYGRWNPGSAASLLGATFLIGGLAMSVIILGRWPAWRLPAVYALVVAGTLALGSGAVLAAKLYGESNRVEAVVLVPTSDVRSGPGETNPQLTEIHEGLKVSVLSSREDWLQIRLPNGITGWVRQTHAEVI